MDDLKKAIRSIPDFPKKGIVFRDITTLLADPDAFGKTLDRMETYCRERQANKIVAIESRGFLFGGALANRLGVSLVIVRKPGKLPGETIAQEYELEYGTDKIEIHSDSIQNGDSVVVIDDLVATGGTLEASCKLIEKAGGEVAGISVLVDLAFIPWREKLKGYDIQSLVKYDRE
ncbi:MAG TPA: adenine phosphoribosyltransferase [candidate division Zixibacteria bacterium]|nr:adenine phosphoribosyltransferase [candidate division Zixibacteria bacterium]